MDFKQHCTRASILIQELVAKEEDLEQKLERLDENRTNTNLLTSIVRGLMAANSLAETIRYEHIAQVAQEEPDIANALVLALDEVLKRLWSIHDDLEVITKLPNLRGARETKVVRFDPYYLTRQEAS
jgi:hypothetical protein